MKFKVNDLIILLDARNNNSFDLDEDDQNLEVHGNYPDKHIKAEGLILKINNTHVLVNVNNSKSQSNKSNNIVLWYFKKDVLKTKTLSYEETL
jgi:hypothetical protein